MVEWNVEQRILTVECYVKTESVAKTQCSFCTKFGNEHKGCAPSRNTVISWVKQWRETGSVVPMK
jgi:transposase